MEIMFGENFLSSPTIIMLYYIISALPWTSNFSESFTFKQSTVEESLIKFNINIANIYSIKK